MNRDRGNLPNHPCTGGNTTLGSRSLDCHAQIVTTSEPLGGGSQQPDPAYAQQPTAPHTNPYAPTAQYTDTTAPPPYGQQPYGPPQNPEPKQGRNVLALIAFITSVVGFIFACIPGALIVGWVLLPIAFILAIVSLFLKGSGKAFGITGLILSVIGTIVGVVVFFAVVATSFDDAFGSGPTKIDTSSAPEESADAPAAEPDAAEGTRENPVAIGATISSDDWTVVVNSYSTDANAAVAAANSFNEAAPAGSHYEMINYTVTYNGADSAIAALVGVDVVTSSGNVINSFDNFVVLGDSMGLDELFTGASATGSAAFLVPDGETVLIRVRPGMVADEVFVKP